VPVLTLACKFGIGRVAVWKILQREKRAA
jgi:hypothetical protein